MKTYKIQAGDTLTAIAKKYNTSVDAIASANGIKNKNLIYTGDTLNIPDGTYDSSISEITVSNKLPVTEDKGISSDRAMDDIKKWQSQRPVLPVNTYGDDIRELIGDITGMEFNYNPKEDMAYKLISEENRKNARLAMEDAMGKASALTGGYANTFAEGAAQQAYGAEISKSIQYIPELYKAAYSRFDDERDSLFDAVNLLADLDAGEFDKYTALMKQYLSEGEMLFDNYEWQSKEEFDRFLDYAEFLEKAAK